MGADSNVVCTLVASFSVTREENSSRQFSVSVINFLADKNNKAWATLGISNSEHHREQLSVLSGNLSPFSGIFFQLLNVGLQLVGIASYLIHHSRLRWVSGLII